MKRFVTLCAILLLTAVAGAQTMPPEYDSDYFGVGGPFEVESLIVDYHFPWSMPDAVVSHIYFGDIEFTPDAAVITDHTLAKVWCGGPFCVAHSPISVMIQTVYEWSPEYHTYVTFQESGAWTGITQYDVLAVDLSWQEPTAHRYHGSLDGAPWNLHPHAAYTDYFVGVRRMPIVSFLSLMMESVKE